jgi:DNA mismatch endonuclease, patch repair protein
MADVFDLKTRRRVMQAVKSKNTVPELVVRSLLHRMGFRFRLHRKDLPGIPDIVFPSRHAVIFVHGCFWHGHSCLRGKRKPKNNADYWGPKIKRNKKRSITIISALKHLGWRILVVWECELKNKDTLQKTLLSFLKNVLTA